MLPKTRRLVYFSAIQPPAALRFEIGLRWLYPDGSEDEPHLVWEALGFDLHEQDLFLEAGAYYAVAFRRGGFEDWPGPNGAHPGFARRLIKSLARP